MLSKRKRQAMADVGPVDPNMVDAPALAELWKDAAPPPKAARYVSACDFVSAPSLPDH